MNTESAPASSSAVALAPPLFETAKPAVITEKRSDVSREDETGDDESSTIAAPQTAAASTAPDLGPAPFPSTVGPYPHAAVLPAPPPFADETATGPQHAAEDYKPPRALTEIMPNFSSDDGSVFPNADIQVQLTIDDKGRVTGAQLLAPSGSKPPAFALDSLAAARRWTFMPALMGGKPVQSTATITFHLKPHS